MHRTIFRVGSAPLLIAGVLVLLAGIGVVRALWLYFHLPFYWVGILAWLIVPLVPFVLRYLSVADRSSNDKGVGGVC